MVRTAIVSIFVLQCLLSSCGDRTLFKKISSSRSGISFSNTIVENDSVNVLDFENVYNGGGVGIGDFNNDGLQDVYFTGNQVAHRLYLNKGDLEFEDVTAEAGVGGNGTWGRGVAVVDINNDGWQDLYVCTSVKKNPAERQNLLYINQGMDQKGRLRFTEMAADYGLNDTTHSTMAAFFDYDNDQDLDVFILANQIIPGDFPNRFRPRMLNGEHPSTGRLYRNDWDAARKHAFYTDVSKEAGTLIEGYGHGIAVADINQDGWKDMYISNDYLSNNILYINNGDGTFTDKVTTYFKHTSANAMGNDVIDINNDGLPDVIELDMNPEDNYRKKMMMNANSYQTYQNSDLFGYQYQYVRNTLQLNNGPSVKSMDSISNPVFSDIAFFAGVAETDWSWTPLVSDFDNDGYRDLIITNGFPRDVTDHDFIAFRNEAFAVASKKQILEQIPAVKIHNYAFRNNHDLTFENKTDDWGLTEPSFSNGAAYADLDNDGDMDFVVNNINDEAFVYENRLPKKGQHFLSLRLHGDAANRDGLGALIEIHYDGMKQFYEQTPYRGYLSSIQGNPHFGLGAVKIIDSICIKWPGGKLQCLYDVAADQTIAIHKNQAQSGYSWERPARITGTLFTDVTDRSNIRHTYEERDFVDFNIQKLLPHKFSEYGPAVAAGDLDGNGLDDLIVGGSFSNSATMFLQQTDGSFRESLLIENASNHNKRWEDMGIALFDADGDRDLDIYIASGGNENEKNSVSYEDKFYLNDGQGRFSILQGVVPPNRDSKSCVRPADFDRDGDMDLFVAGRVLPWHYPMPVSSYLYRNDSKDGKVQFTDVTQSVAGALQGIGMVCDAVWTDTDNDGWQDLMLAGEWMPLTVLKNNKGSFEKNKNISGLEQKSGWWTSLLPGDFDNDGDIDYIAGNLGLNSFYRASEKYPVRIYANDFDNNGNYDAVPTLYLRETLESNKKKEFVAHVRDDMTKQMISFRSKFQKYGLYARADFKEMFTGEELKNAVRLEANYFSNSLVKNNGGGKFEIVPLPAAAQYACINGMVSDDFDGDGNLDLLISGNDYGTEVSVGRYDACNGLLLKGDGKGNFTNLPMLQSGFYLPGNAKAMAAFSSADGGTLIAASQNRGPLKIFQMRRAARTVSLLPDDVAVVFRLKNNSTQKRELNHGASFLSQSARFVRVPEDVQEIAVINSKGARRNLQIPN